MSLVAALILVGFLSLALQIVFGVAALKGEYKNMHKWVAAYYACGAGALVLMSCILALYN